MKLTPKQIQIGSDIAYKKSGDNAYFENGFRAGVKLAESKTKDLLYNYSKWLEKNYYEDNDWNRVKGTLKFTELIDEFLNQNK